MCVYIIVWMEYMWKALTKTDWKKKMRRRGKNEREKRYLGQIYNDDHDDDDDDDDDDTKWNYYWTEGK